MGCGEGAGAGGIGGRGGRGGRGGERAGGGAGSKGADDGESGSRLVYSTDGGRMCPRCRRPLPQCTCRATRAAVPLAPGPVRVSRESKGRGGKTVTLVRGLPLPAAELEALGKQLRSHCGSGGTVKDGVVEVQGDHAERVLAWLLQRGHAAKRAGG
jgi:translation initiation factor 1